MQTVAFKPLDTLFFRNGKPFNMDEDNWAEGQFIPFPSVFYGAIRSAYFSENRSEIDTIGKQNDPTKELQITQRPVCARYPPKALLPTSQRRLVS